VAGDRLIPLASIHPADPDAVARVRAVKEAGLKGLKLHPYYQNFDLGSEAIFPLYAAVADAGLILVAHTGFDMAFPHDDRAAPDRVLKVIGRFPNLRFMATHLGAWQDWGSMRKTLLGKPLLMETSLALESLPATEARALLTSHSPDHLMFGTDSPWGDQAEALARLRALDLPPELLRKILGGNAVRVFAD
jgi:predicted TIM-barrel fold metal-dependent hydrolase